VAENGEVGDATTLADGSVIDLIAAQILREYRTRGLLIEVDGGGDVEVVSSRVRERERISGR
jgi:hypothetical protein